MFVFFPQFIDNKYWCYKFGLLTTKSLIKALRRGYVALYLARQEHIE